MDPAAATALDHALTAEGADSDCAETLEWREAFESVMKFSGGERALFLLRELEQRARELGLVAQAPPYSAYRNSIALQQQPPFPGDLALEEHITSIMRWNALVMVIRANREYGDLGGHIASYASAAEIFEVGFNHFFRGHGSAGGGDLLFVQPHSAPGIYARAFLEGRLTEEQLAHFRREIAGNGLCSYPHPWLMPQFWQFPTGSMGIGVINAIYHARFMRYLRDRGLAATDGRRVWGVFGDGEMDEPESVGALTLAAREKLDNLTLIINCNLQRLDGPVRGNGQIIQELESLFVGAGWHVIKVLWSSDWDALFARDREHALLRALSELPDGAYQTLGANDGKYNLEYFFARAPQLQNLVSHMDEAEIDSLRRGGHDMRKLHAAFSAAQAHRGQPTVILAKTKKGYGMGGTGESRMTAHQKKKLDAEALKAVRDRLRLPLSDADVEELRFYKPDAGGPVSRYLRERRSALGGFLPARLTQAAYVPVPPLESYARFAVDTQDKAISTTMAIARMLTNLLRDKQLGPKIVPIVADEARTFGMANLFRQIGIYSPVGQCYEPEDSGSLLSYREARDGQLLEEGITEAGALSSWVAAATSYSVHGLRLLPFYIYYSMFGFQRVGDIIWAAADQRARGFLLGATAGRTTLGGEGLQHQDGSSHIVAATVPNCRAYDPAFACELAVIVDYGMRQMMERDEDQFYYVTVMNESYPQPSLRPGVESQIIQGMYRYATHEVAAPIVRVRLLGSGAILREAIGAAELLATQWNVEAEVWSVTSYSELARDAREVERWNRLHPAEDRRFSHVQLSLPGTAPVVAASDYVRAYPQIISSYLNCRFIALGTDGFGRSDTRAALRRFFEVDRHHIVVAALDALAQDGAIDRRSVADAIRLFELNVESTPSWNC